MKKCLCLLLALLMLGSCLPAGASAQTLVTGVPKAGDTFRMGYYEQDDNFANGREPIEWTVLAVDQKKDTVLVISTMALECLTYHPYRAAVKWPDAYLRLWLNYGFAQTAFSGAELGCILPTKNDGALDLVTMLDEKQIKKYDLAPDGCPVTPYAEHRGVNVAEDNGLGCWWVRTAQAKSDGKVKFVGRHGKVYFSNYTTTSDNGIRPAMTLRLSALQTCEFLPDGGVYELPALHIGATNSKIASRSGPDTNFDEIHTFALPRGTVVRLLRYQVTGGTPWVEIEFEYKGEMIRLWTGLKRIDYADVSGLPGDYQAYERAVVAQDTPGWYGPGSSYRVLYKKVAAGTSAEVLAQENSWYLIEYLEPERTENIVRTWVPGDVLDR